MSEGCRERFLETNKKEYITFGEIFFTGNLCVASLLLALFSLDFFLFRHCSTFVFI